MTNTTPITRVVRDGFVAVVYAPSYGAGWSTWSRHYAEFLMFDSRIVEAVEANDDETIRSLIEEMDVYDGAIEDLTIAWIAEGSKFRITEYDGSEKIEVMDRINWFVA